MASEQTRIKQRLLSEGEHERLFRINAGMGWTGSKVVRLGSGDILIKKPRPFHGAPTGFPDTIGWQTVTVTQDMVGKEVAVFVAEEHKRGKNDTLRKMQSTFKRVIEKMGGIHRVLW